MECTRAGFNRRQILEFSKVWDRPLYDQGQVKQIQHRLRLVSKDYVSPHKSSVTEQLCKLAKEGAAKGWKLLFWEIEHELTRSRADYYVDLRKDDKMRLFFGEEQLTGLSKAGWRDKLKPYVELYQSWKIPFKVLVGAKGQYMQERIVQITNELLVDEPHLNLILVNIGTGWVNRWGQTQELLD